MATDSKLVPMAVMPTPAPVTVPRRPRWQRAAKRTIDVVVAAVGLVLSAPVLALSALAIVLHDRGPVIYRQVRVGRHGVPFTMLKLRTMVVGAEDLVVDLRSVSQREGPLFKLARDPRVTRVGRVLRLSSIDELPQLVNVLRGEMSVVGPRPALPTEVALFEPALLARHEVRPGITGLWQVQARDHRSFALYQELDLRYVERWSIALDASVIVLTIGAALRRIVRALPGRCRSSVLD